ncbi:MAG: hypothetical protein ACRD28_08705 [Acidobacteriaceae bacterium]
MTKNVGDLTNNAPAKPQEETVGRKEEDTTAAHRRLEQDAMKAAERAREREREEEGGEFTGIGTF